MNAGSKQAFSLFALLLAALFALAACTDNADAPAETTPDNPVSLAPANGDVKAGVTLPGEETVLATVNGKPISEYDLELTMDSMLGPAQAALLDEKGRQKVLESLVLSRLMAAALEAELDAEELAEVEKKTYAYREQLLAKLYLKRHASPQPVTEEMVSNYYQQNPERFGGKRLRSYQLLVEAQQSGPAERQAVMDVLSAAADKEDWQAYLAGLGQSGKTVQFRSGQVDDSLLHPQLLALLSPLKVGDTSPVTYIQGRAYIARIVDEKHTEPRPLADVSAEIRRTLAPMQLKLAIKEVSDNLYKNARIEYPQQAGTPQQ